MFTFASIFRYVFLFVKYVFLPKYLPLSVSLSLFACLLLVCLAATLILSLYFLSVYTVIVSFDFVTQSFFASIITHHLLFHFFIRPLGRIQDIDFERHGLPLASVV